MPPTKIFMQAELTLPTSAFASLLGSSPIEEFQKLQTEVLRLEKEEIRTEKKKSRIKYSIPNSQQQLTQLQIKEIKTKKIFAIIGAVGGILLTIITKYLLRILKLK